jgi:hypothetical protein
MAEILLGDLSQTKFFDLIKPLLVEKKTGLLKIEGDEYGEIFLEGGNIIHARNAYSFGEEAFISIMNWQTGKAKFQPDVASQEKTIFTQTENLLLNWTYKKEEWEKIRMVVPSPNAIFQISLQHHSEDKNIKGDQWNVLALANGTRTVLEIARILKWDEFKTSKIICQLAQEKVLEIGRGETIDRGFFQKVEKELKNVMGPIASILIDDLLTEFGENKESFPQDRALTFVETLSKEVSDERKRREFKKTMMEFITPLK